MFLPFRVRVKPLGIIVFFFFIWLNFQSLLSSGYLTPCVLTKEPIIRAGYLSSHQYRADGLVDVNPDAEHPIFELMRDAEEKWERKLAAASKTLEEAVSEYKRRYKRPPPRGFDDWWEYSSANNVQLPDEYDAIWRDIEMFWGIDPEDLVAAQRQQESVPDRYTIAKTETSTTQLIRFDYPERWVERGLLRGLQDILDILQPVENYLPPFRATFSPHDNPSLASDYHVKKAAIDAARAGKSLKAQDLPPIKSIGFNSGCAPGSPGRQTEIPIDHVNRPPPRTNKTFIHDHRRSMDPCAHPHLFYFSTQYLSPDIPIPQQLPAPQFVACSTPMYHDIQPPFLMGYVDELPEGQDVPWEEKHDERIFWRGSNTGMNAGPDRDEIWRYAQRMRLSGLVNDMNGTVKVLMENREGVSVGDGTEIAKRLVNPAFFDVAMTGRPLGCGPEYCPRLEELYEFRKYQPNGNEAAARHKYLVDVDGQGWSSRFKRLITMNSLVFKATVYPEWWIDRVQPWLHYVPVQTDYSDLYDAYFFFRGGLYGEGNHEDLARKIALEGTMWSKTFWRAEDMTAYLYRLILEYARVMSVDREEMNYEG